MHLPPEKPGLVLFRIRVKVTDILLGTCQITVQGEGREAKGDRAQEHMWQVKEREHLSQETHVSPTAQPECRLKRASIKIRAEEQVVLLVGLRFGICYSMRKNGWWSYLTFLSWKWLEEEG